MLNPTPHLLENRPTQNIKTRSCALTLSLALTFAPMLSLALPSSALAQGANGQTYTYDKLIDVTDSNQYYYFFAGNVWNATNISTYSTGNTSVNNILYVKSGAGLNITVTNKSYEVAGAAGYIALNGSGISATATNNTAIMDAEYDENNQNAGGYISNLTGAYIGINNYSDNTGRLDIPTTVDTITASNNSVILKNGYVGLGTSVSATNYDDVGNYLTGAYVQSYNINADAQFNLYNNSVLIEGGVVAYTIGDITIGALAGAYVNTVTGNATMSNNSVTITGGGCSSREDCGCCFQ